MIFREDTHTYTHEGVPYESITRFVSRFHEHFDTKAQAEKYAKKHNLLIEDVLADWEFKGKKASKRGHIIHKLKEDELHNSSTTTFKHEESNGEKIGYTVEQLQSLEPGVYPEMILYLPRYKLCGTSDKVIIYPDKTFDIEDYKTSIEIKMNSFRAYNKNTGTREPKYMFKPFNNLEDCVSGDTKLLTKNGVTLIKDAVGKTINIWNGKEWTITMPFKTKENTEIFRVTFSDGSYLDVTSNHKFLIKYRLDRDFKEQTTLDIIKVMSKTKWLPRIPDSNITVDFDGTQVNDAYDYGFVLGDGTVETHNKSIKAELYNNDKKLSFVTGKPRIYKNTTIHYFNLDYNLAKKLKYEVGLPLEIFRWNKSSILQFLAGWIDADGSNQLGKVRLYGREDKLRDAQLLFTKCNIKSSLKLFSKKGTITNLGVRKNDVWYLSISKTIDIPCQRVICDKERESTKKHKWQHITNIVKLDGKQDSYCLNEPKLNQCVFNNVLTKQCNFNHYSIQLSSYAYMLEAYGYICKGLRLIHLELEELTDNIEDFSPETIFIKKETIYEVPYLKNQVETAFKFKK